MIKISHRRLSVYSIYTTSFSGSIHNKSTLENYEICTKIYETQRRSCYIMYNHLIYLVVIRNFELIIPLYNATCAKYTHTHKFRLARSIILLSLMNG